jgi:hypothetical protein
MRLDTSWTQPKVSFLNRFTAKCNDLNEVDPTRLTDDKRRQWLKRALEPDPTMSGIMKTYNSFNSLQGTLNGSNKILKPDFDHFFTFLETQAEAYDAEFKLVQRHKRVQKKPARNLPIKKWKRKGKNNGADKSNKNDKNEQKKGKDNKKPRSDAWKKEFQRWKVDSHHLEWMDPRPARSTQQAQACNALDAITQAEAKGQPLPHSSQSKSKLHTPTTCHKPPIRKS